MKLRYLSMIGTVTAFTAASALLVPAAAPAQSTEVEADEDAQVLTRGPVHEAFAESVSSQPEPGLIIANAPPEAIEELPPEQQLEGDNVTWISGYWAWDDDQNDFLWISGIWRNLPPGRQWVPGYWSALDDGRNQWTSGYWADSEAEEVAYIPEPPPQTVDVGPNVEAPSEDHTWIPGNWVYGESRYAWRPGYWTPLRENWTWVPSRYCWSPRGYIYVDGYWDYAVARRGILFAPVHFRRHVWAEPSYYYTPSVVVSLSVFSDHLFYRPRASHYYFGDYYAPRYSGLGFYASHSWHNRRGCFDPIYAHNRWNHRHDRGWDRRQSERFDFFRNNEDARPLHNWAAMRNFRGDRFSNDERGRGRQFANSLAGFAKNPTGGQRFRNLDRDGRQQFVAQNREVRNLGQQRRQLESRKVTPADGAGKMALRQKLGRSPVVGRQAERFAKNEAPPKRPEARGTNIRLNPKNQQPGVGRGNDAANRADRGRGALAQRDANRDPAAKGQARENRKPVQPGAANRNNERDPAAKAPARADRNPAAPGIAKRDTSPKPQARQLPGRKADAATQRQANRELPGRRNDVTPQRQVQPKPQVRPTPQRQQQATPQRQVQPKPQARQTPQRQAVPQRQAQPQRQARPTPQRQQQATPQRQSQPKPQVRQAPQRKPQAAPQRQSQPRPQARQAPQRQPQQAQRQFQPRPQARPAPQRQAAPQRQVQPRQQQQARPQPQQRQQQRQAPQQRQQRQKNRADA